MPTNSQTFVDYSTPAVNAAWLNDIDHSTYEAVIDVKNYGAIGDGVTDDYDAFADAWDAVKTVGGTLRIPPGDYLLGTAWTLDITSPKNIKIEGFGATLFADTAVTTAAIKVYGSYNQTVLEIAGIAFNHRGNSTVQGCIDIQGGHCVTVRQCTSEQHNTKSGWYFCKLGTKTPGASEDSWNSFWCRIIGNTTRMRSGGDGTPGDYGIVLQGAVNGCTIRDNVFSDVNEGVYIYPAGTTYTLPNALIIDGNNFETLTNTAIKAVGTPGQYGPTGWRIVFNRVETTPTFFSFTTGGAAATQHSQPPILFGNYLTAGSVTNWVSNPTNYNIAILEVMTPGFSPTVENQWYMPGGMSFTFGGTGGLTLQNPSGAGDYSIAWLRQAGYYYWTNTSNGKFYEKATAPTNNTDGTVVGTQT